jgi:copper(I)-binding protein
MSVARWFIGAIVASLAWSAAPWSTRAADFTVGSLKIAAPWSRATPPRSKVAAGYMSVQNNGSEADRLVSAETPAAQRAEIHQSGMKDGVMTMRPVAGGIAIAPGKDVTLAPNGLHIMFFDLKAPLKQGDKIPVTLRFEKAGKVDVEFDVQAAGASAPGAAHGSGHKM